MAAAGLLDTTLVSSRSPPRLAACFTLVQLFSSRFLFLRDEEKFPSGKLHNCGNFFS